MNIFIFQFTIFSRDVDFKNHTTKFWIALIFFINFDIDIKFTNFKIQANFPWQTILQIRQIYMAYLIILNRNDIISYIIQTKSYNISRPGSNRKKLYLVWVRKMRTLKNLFIFKTIFKIHMKYQNSPMNIRNLTLSHLHLILQKRDG